jgi:hypothetical protein
MYTMRTALALLAAACLLAASTTAQEKTDTMRVEIVLHGYIVDAMCAAGMAKHPETAMKKAAEHTRTCALEEECAKSGYGLFSEGKWYKFDGPGDKRARELLRNTKEEKGMMVKATGTMVGDRFAVATLAEKSKEGKKGKTPAKSAGQK